MTIAASNFATLAYAEEVSYGVLPAVAFQYIPFTGETLQFSKESISSNNINSTRQISDLIQTGFSVGGGFDFELASMFLDEFIEGAMWSRWSTPVDTNLTMTFGDGAGATVQDDDNGDEFSNLVAGQYIQIQGTVLNDGVYQVASVSSTPADTITITSDYSFSTEESVSNTLIKGSTIRNGATDISYYIEKQLSDLSPEQYFSFSGNRVNTFNVSAQSSSIITGSIEFLGKTSTAYTGSSGSTGAVTASVSGGILNAVRHIDSVLVNDAAPATTYFQGLDFSLSNNLRGVQAIANLGNVDVLAGQFEVTGTLNAYFADDVMYQRFLDDTEFKLSYTVIDNDTKEGYMFTFPRVIISTEDMSAGGNDQDMIENLSFQSLVTASTATIPSSSIQIDRFLSDYTSAPDQ